MCGVYLPTLEEVELYNVMGLGWNAVELGLKVKNQQYWSQLLWKLLMDEEMFSAKDVNFLRPHVQATQGCGYTAFYNLCRVLGHPKLQEGACPTDIPKHNATMSFVKYVKLVRNHIWSSSLVGHVYTNEQGIHLVLSNLHPKYKHRFLEEKLR